MAAPSTHRACSVSLRTALAILAGFLLAGVLIGLLPYDNGIIGPNLRSDDIPIQVSTPKCGEGHLWV